LSIQEVIGAIEDGLMSIFASWPIIIVQLLATFFLFLIIRAFLWRPITEFLAKRQEALSKELFEAKQLKEAANKLKTDTINEVEAIKTDILSIKEQTINFANEQKDLIIEEANKEAKKRLLLAEEEIKQEIVHNSDLIKEKIKEVAILGAEVIIKSEVNEKKYDSVLDDIISKNL